ncbi:MAG: hypothetical protein JST73_13155 [Actinobacteria bacterium]|nr:hypothetical protein [Actinomycetota bacterium]
MDRTEDSGPTSESADARTTDEIIERDDDIGRSQRSRMWVFPAIAAVVFVGFAVATYFVLVSKDPKAPKGPEGVAIQNVPDLAAADSTVQGTPVNGITCRPAMGQNVKFHIHQHVTVFVNGEQQRIPAGVGITKPWWIQKIDGFPFINNSTKSCVYWLHTHANDGIIHLESPESRTFTLGDFFDVWNQPLSSRQVGPAKGPVTAFVDGKRFAGDPRNIALTDHGVIQLDVGVPVVPFQPLEFTVKNVCGDGTLSCSPTETTAGS